MPPDARATSVVFVAPFFLETTLRFVEAVASLPGVRIGLVSQDPVEKLPSPLRRRTRGASARHRRARRRSRSSTRCAMLANEIGPPSRLLGALEQLQVPLGEAREALGIEGMGVRGGAATSATRRG